MIGTNSASDASLSNKTDSQLAATFCMAAVELICRGERSDRFADSRIVLRIRL